MLLRKRHCGNCAVISAPCPGCCSPRGVPCHPKTSTERSQRLFGARSEAQSSGRRTGLRRFVDKKCFIPPQCALKIIRANPAIKPAANSSSAQFSLCSCCRGAAEGSLPLQLRLLRCIFPAERSVPNEYTSLRFSTLAPDPVPSLQGLPIRRDYQVKCNSMEQVEYPNLLLSPSPLLLTACCGVLSSQA
jgi:hypothetical protein